MTATTTVTRNDGLAVMGGLLEAELIRTAELLEDIQCRQGLYYVVAFLYDSGYDLDRLGKLLQHLDPRIKEPTHNERQRTRQLDRQRRRPVRLVAIEHDEQTRIHQTEQRRDRRGD